MKQSTLQFVLFGIGFAIGGGLGLMKLRKSTEIHLKIFKEILTQNTMLLNRNKTLETEIDDFRRRSPSQIPNQQSTAGAVANAAKDVSKTVTEKKD